MLSYCVALWLVVSRFSPCILGFPEPKFIFDQTIRARDTVTYLCHTLIYGTVSLLSVHEPVHIHCRSFSNLDRNNVLWAGRLRPHTQRCVHCKYGRYRRVMLPLTLCRYLHPYSTQSRSLQPARDSSFSAESNYKHHFPSTMPACSLGSAHSQRRLQCSTITS